MKKAVCVLVNILLVFGLVVGCGNVQKQSNQKVPSGKVKVACLQGPTAIGMIKMLDEKPSLGTNNGVEYQVLKTPDLLLSKLLSKEVDIATVPTNLAAKVYNKGVDYKLAGMNTWGVLYLVGTEKGIKTWSDLKGKTIYSVGKGTTPDIIARYILEKNKLDYEKDVKFDYTVAQVELAQMVAGGKVGLALLPEPFVTVAMMKNKEVKIIFDVQDEWLKLSDGKAAFAQTCLVVKGELARNNPELVKKFLEAHRVSIDWANANPKEAGLLTEKNNIGLKAKIVENAVPRCNMRFEDAQDAKFDIETYLNVLSKYSPKDIGGKLPDENFYFKK